MSNNRPLRRDILLVIIVALLALVLYQSHRIRDQVHQIKHYVGLIQQGGTP